MLRLQSLPLQLQVIFTTHLLLIHLLAWVLAQPITKEQFEAGFAQYDAWKAQQDSDKAAVKQALLDKLGITAEEATLLLS
jgi:hypothetical protein